MKKKIIASALGILCIMLIVSLALSGCKTTTASETTVAETTAAATTAAATTAAETTAAAETSAVDKKVWEGEIEKGADIVFVNLNGNAELDEKMEKGFMAKYPEIKLTSIGLSGDVMTAQKQRIVAQEAIDITDVRPENIQDFTANGYLMDITGAPVLDNVIDKKYFGNLTVDGKTYGVPHSMVRIGIWYNKTIFNELGLQVPVTWDQFITLLDDLQEAGYEHPIINGWLDSWPTMFSVYPFLHAVFVENPDMFKKIDNKEAKYTDEVWINCFKQIDEFFKKGYIGKNNLSTAYTDQASLFVQKKTPILIDGDWGAGLIGNVEDLDFELGVFYMPYPGVEDGDEITAPVNIGQNWAITSFTKYPVAAMKFLEWLTTPEGAVPWVDIWGFTTVYKGVKLPENSAKVFSELATGNVIDFFYSHLSPGVVTALNAGLQDLYLGKVTAEELANNLQKIEDQQ